MDNNHILSGVTCTVGTCAYHCADNCCAAQKIEVHQEGNAPKCSSETLCSTYKNVDMPQ